MVNPSYSGDPSLPQPPKGLPGGPQLGSILRGPFGLPMARWGPPDDHFCSISYLLLDTSTTLQRMLVLRDHVLY